MKSLSDINAEITSLQLTPNIGLFDDGLERDEPKKRNQSMNKKRLAFLILCRNYLETKPSEEYLKTELVTLNELVVNIGKVTVPHTFWPANFSGDQQKYFDEKMGINDLRDKISTIRYILDC